MIRKKYGISILLFCISAALFFAFFNYPKIAAQTANPAENRARKVFSPTPTPVRSPVKTPVDDDFYIEPPPPPVEDVVGPIIVKTELVNLDVRVIDRNNRPINNLNKDEFKIYENGILQPIEFFSKSEVPTNYSLVIDNSGSLRMQLEKVIEASKIIIGTNRPDDETSLIRFISTDKIEIVQDFTSNKTDLFDELDDLFTEGGQTAIIDAVYLSAEMLTEYENTDTFQNRKRRALILVSDGEDRNSTYNEQQLFDLLRESDVQIYTIGFIGELDSQGGFISKSPQKKAKSFLERLAEETGGKAYFPDNLNQLNQIAGDIASELRTQYSIGYQPTNDRKDGTFREIKVRIDDGPKNQKRIAVTRTGRVAGGKDDAGAGRKRLKANK